MAYLIQRCLEPYDNNNSGALCSNNGNYICKIVVIGHSEMLELEDSQGQRKLCSNHSLWLSVLLGPHCPGLRETDQPVQSDGSGDFSVTDIKRGCGCCYV